LRNQKLSEPETADVREWQVTDQLAIWSMGAQIERRVPKCFRLDSGPLAFVSRQSRPMRRLGQTFQIACCVDSDLDFLNSHLVQNKIVCDLMHATIPAANEAAKNKASPPTVLGLRLSLLRSSAQILAVECALRWQLALCQRVP
jgi:hypothetical protein